MLSGECRIRPLPAKTLTTPFVYSMLIADKAVSTSEPDQELA
jgi:hypothetical protein